MKYLLTPFRVLFSLLGNSILLIPVFLIYFTIACLWLFKTLSDAKKKI